MYASEFRRMKVVEKSWGYEEWVANSPMYCGKLLHVEENGQCSLHHHEQKHETFLVLEGRIILQLDGVDYVLENSGGAVDIMPYTQHRFQAIDGPAVILEVSTQHFEGDSIRA